MEELLVNSLGRLKNWQTLRNAIVALAHEKSWQLHAIHVRSNHVHTVVTTDRDPNRLMSELKARASRDLTLAGFEDVNRKRWTRHGSTLHLFNDAQIERNIHYTLYEQGQPMSFYDGRTEPRTK